MVKTGGIVDTGGAWTTSPLCLISALTLMVTASRNILSTHITAIRRFLKIPDDGLPDFLFSNNSDSVLTPLCVDDPYIDVPDWWVKSTADTK